MMGLYEINFAFECKGTSKPWVLFTSEETADRYHRLSSFGIFSKPAFSSVAGELFDIGIEKPATHEKAKAVPWLWKEENIGYSIIQAFEGNKDVAYSATLAATKAALWLKENSVWQDGEYLTHTITFPVVVTFA